MSYAGCQEQDVTGRVSLAGCHIHGVIDTWQDAICRVSQAGCHMEGVTSRVSYAGCHMQVVKGSVLQVGCHRLGVTYRKSQALGRMSYAGCHRQGDTTRVSQAMMARNKRRMPSAIVHLRQCAGSEPSQALEEATVGIARC